MFLDIEMPEVTGTELLKNIRKNLLVVVITSTPDFVPESYSYYGINENRY